MRIEEIFIQNFAVIENLRLEFGPGLNVMTGETGAGKSIVLEALRFLFGEAEAPARYIRSKGRSVEAAARVCWDDNEKRLSNELQNSGVEPEQREILVRRIYDANTGRSRLMIDDKPVTLGALRRLARLALEVQIQGQSRELEEAPFAREFLDEWANLDDLREAYSASYQAWQESERLLTEHRTFIQEHANRLEFLEHQCREMAELPQNLEELERLEAEIPELLEQDKFIQTCRQLRQELGAIESALRARETSRRVLEARPDSSAAQGLDEELSACERSLEGAQGHLKELEQSIQWDPIKLEQMLHWRSKARGLMTKYRCSSPMELFALRQKLESERDRLVNQEIEKNNLEKNLDQWRRPARTQAKELSQKRSQAALKLGRWVTQALGSLGMEHALFEVEVSALENPLSSGQNEVRFWLTPNPGMSRRELRDIASGGEMSRLSLLLRAALLEKPMVSMARSGGRSWPVLLFDEVEQGLSVQAAILVGQKLKALGERYQIILVTHSPVIAAMALRHYALQKTVTHGETATTGLPLEAPWARQEEVLRLLGAKSDGERKKLLPYVEGLLKTRVAE
ncbi:MAG: AAA family ATPase [Elusimicrobia bacterium]|nr:AAA family ATPase [Elusimicrobiota bacterium]